MLLGRSRFFAKLGEEGASSQIIISRMSWAPETGQRFLECLAAIGLLDCCQGTYFPSPFSRRFFLADSSQGGQQDALNFEEQLVARWQDLEESLQTGKISQPEKSPRAYKTALKSFIGAMHNAAQPRATELWASFSPKESGTILDIGAGSGAYLVRFLDENPGWQGIFCDLDDVVALAQADPALAAFEQRISYVKTNLLDPQTDLFRLLPQKVDILLFSNLLHCQSEKETADLLARTLPCLNDSGLAVAHDFYKDLNWQGALYDIHMMLNTYNGRTYSTLEIAGHFKALGFGAAEVLSLPSGSAVLLAAQTPAALPDFSRTHLISREARRFGFNQAVFIDPATIKIGQWPLAKCQFGCAKYDKGGSCPPNSLPPEQMAKMLSEYSRALVLAGPPPLADYQNNLLELEKFSFLAGYHKALAFGAGPCSICPKCIPDECRFPAKRRPALEACGCDVYQLAGDCGIDLHPLRNRTDFVQYISLLLVE